MLVQDIDSAERRAISLRDAGMTPFAQPYRDFENNIPPSAEQRAFAQWVNKKSVFRSVETFAEYNPRIRGHNRDRENALKYEYFDDDDICRRRKND